MCAQWIYNLEVSTIVYLKFKTAECDLQVLQAMGVLLDTLVILVTPDTLVQLVTQVSLVQLGDLVQLDTLVLLGKEACQGNEVARVSQH